MSKINDSIFENRETKHQFKNRKRRVAHFSVTKTVVNGWWWIKNANEKGFKELEKASLEVWKELITQVGTIYAKHAGKNTNFNYM
jgi:hypothetical protein